MPQSSALDRLFPEAMRYHKGRVARLQHRKSSGAGLPQLVRLSPRQKLTGIVRRSPEVMLKIGRANIRCLKHMQAAADYISRNGKLEIEDQDGFMLDSKEKIQAKRVKTLWRKTPQPLLRKPSPSGPSGPPRPPG